MYDAVRRDFALSTSFVLECFDGSEVVLIRLVIFLDAIVHLATTDKEIKIFVTENTEDEAFCMEG